MRREHLVNKLREIGFSFRKQHWRVAEWRRGTPKMVVMIPERDDLDESVVRNILRQAGCPADDIDAFVRISRC